MISSRRKADVPCAFFSSMLAVSRPSTALRPLSSICSRIIRQRASTPPHLYPSYSFHPPRRSMSDLSISLKAPNGLKYTQPTGLFINNAFVPAKSGKKITTINPTDESDICAVHAAGPEDVDDAVAAARKAFEADSWREITPSERGALMLKLADLCEANREKLATIETWDNGKPFAVARDEDLSEVITTLRYYAGWADKLHGQTIDTGPAKFAYTLREPLGVCGQIIPWNYPLGMAAWKLGPALACGNTVVLKPAEQTPLSILVLAELVVEAGFPPGVINIVNGEGRVAGAALAQHLGVDKIAFTGSTATGREIMKMAAVNLKNISLECGGKSPLLVFDDADLDQAVILSDSHHSLPSMLIMDSR